MELTWPKTLAHLQQYIRDNPGISIGTNLVIIPSEVRAEFYRLFDKIESDFIKDYFPDLLEKGNALSGAWAEVSKVVTGQMSLSSIEITKSVQWFLNDPLDGLMRSLSDPLFEVLKGSKNITSFEEEGKRKIKRDFTDYFKEGYRCWATLALLSLLTPDENYRVPAVDQLAEPTMGEGHENPGERASNVPEAEPVNILSFLQHAVVSFVVPKVMVRSARLGRFVALHSEFVEPQWTARGLSRNAEWFDFTALKRDNGLAKIRPDQKIPPDLGKIIPDIAIYAADDLNDIALVADHGRIMRPDLSVEVMEGADWFGKEGLSCVKRHHEVMNPRLGTFIICREPPPQAALDELAPKPVSASQPPVISNPQVSAALTPEVNAPVPPPEPPLDIHIIGAGYDISRLEPICAALHEKSPRTERMNK